MLTLERKAAFIGQVTGGNVDGREIDDIADTALTYAEVKALATGNPLIMEKAGVDAEVARLTRLERSHADEQRRLRRALDTAQHQDAGYRFKATKIEDAIKQRIETKGDAFRMTIDGGAYTKRADAGGELLWRGNDLLEATPLNQSRTQQIGTLGGLDVELEATQVIAPEIVVRIGRGVIEARWTDKDWTIADPTRLITSLERRIHRLDEDLAKARAGIERAEDEVIRAESRLGQTFEHADELARARRRQKEIAEELNREPPAVAPTTPAPERPAPVLSR